VGQRAEVYIETSRKESVTLLPAQYVVWRDDAAGVFVSEGGQAVWRSVKTGLRNPQIIEVLEGVQPDDVVVAPVDPRSKLTDARRVSIP
jgi:hypothetical protein